MEDSASQEDIETLIDGMEYIPGHFHLDLNLNCEPQGPAELRSRDTRLKRDSLLAELGAEAKSQQHAVQNLLGLLAFHLDELKQAEEIFRSICEGDPANLNAWTNLGYVYDRLKKEAKGAECVEKVSALMGIETGDTVQEDTRLLVARCLAEQAYAHPYDVDLNGEEEHRERLTAAIGLYNKAIGYGSKEIPIEEKRCWYFKMATMYIRLDGMLKDKEESAFHRLTYFNKAVKLLHETIKSDNLHYKALAWCYMGIMLERQEEFYTVPMAVHDCGYSGSDPLSCYGMAIKIAESNAFILNRLAKVFFHLGKHEMATGICNMALDVLPDADLNWQAYCTRAKIHLTTYVQGLEAAKRGLAGVPDRQNLVAAKVDLDKVLNLCPCLRMHLEMGQVYYYMGVDAMQETLLVDEEAINSSLVCLARALECDLGDMLPEVQLLRGKCLLLKGEEQNAAECFKRSMELEPQGSADTQNLRCLLETLLALFTQSSSQPVPAIAQLETWVRRAEERYSRETVQSELQVLCRVHTAEVAELCRAMISTGRLDLVRVLLQTVLPSKHGKRRQLARSLSV
ncbi:tetratricopeptide repeat protein 22 [Lepisosteus oculatus]|nr:PREDICTED: tetratricopeptide repeat protein 22 [Lepisosteus oculatus]